MEMNYRIMKKRFLIKVLFLFCAVLFLLSAGTLISYWRAYREGKEEYEALVRDTVCVRQDIFKEGAQRTDTEPGGQESSDSNGLFPPALSIDFDALSEVNDDVVAWIDFPGQEISYPVVQGDDNDYYLNHTFGNTRNIAGSIFQDARNKGMMTDENTIIYGHNMKNGTMFGLLKKYREKTYLDRFPYFDIYTPDGVYRCRIFAAGNVAAREEYYPAAFSDENERRQYLERMKSFSWYEIPAVEHAEKAPLVLLSTCTGADHNNRFVLAGQAVRFYRNE